ncbi:MAG: sigma-70 family RNA polymerase sigma factor [bacterium]|nr:sigma-70 family RNA polymerase sigma factor [bacterium]
MTDAALFDDLIQHERWLQRLARTLVRGDDDARELVQETFARAIANPPADFSRPKAWLETVLRNLARSLHRRRKPEMLAEEDAELISSTAASPELAIERFEAARAVSDAIDALPAREKRIVLMYWQEDISIANIASIERAHDSTVRKVLASAHDRLRCQLQFEYGEERLVLTLAPLLGDNAKRVASNTAATTAALSPGVLAAVACGALAVGIPAWSLLRTRSSPNDVASLAMEHAAVAAPETPETEAPRTALAARISAGPAQGAGMLEADPEAIPVELVGAGIDAAPAEESGAQPEPVARVGIRGRFLVDGVPAERWHARLRPKHCVEECTVHGTVAKGWFALEREGAGAHRLVLGSVYENGQYEAMALSTHLEDSEVQDFEHNQLTSHLTVTGVPEGHGTLFAYVTNGVGYEFLQGVDVTNGTASFTAAPVGRVEIKVDSGDPDHDWADWPVLGVVEVSRGAPATHALDR